MIAPLQIKENYWEEFSVQKKDIEYIYNLLLDKAIPLPMDGIADEIIAFRIRDEMESLQNQRTKHGNIYLPKDEFKVGDTLIFPAFEMQAGKVTAVREGFNPDFEELKVIDVEMPSGMNRSFASGIKDHPLNHILDIQEEDPNLNPEAVKSNHGEAIKERLEKSLFDNDDLVKIAGNWFPRSLLIDVHIGHLNLAEAVLEEAKGGPISTDSLMKQVELNADADQKLLEFSFNLALQEDLRFDEVGPAGVTLWFLKHLEPVDVQEVPIYLKFKNVEYPKDELQPYLDLFENNLYDELETWDSPSETQNKITISLSFPHWRSGTLPLSSTLKRMFPTAYEAPRVKFTFVDAIENDRFPGWVVRPNKYIFGLKDWYSAHELIPGSLITVEEGKNPGEIVVSYEKSRQNKEWLKTVLVGSDQGIVFAMLKHPITASFNDRMAIAVPDPDAVDEIWKQRIYEKEGFDKTIIRVMRELAKLNPQGQVHAQELYAAVNIVRRCPPGLTIYHLLNSNLVNHLGDLYFQIIGKE